MNIETSNNSCANIQLIPLSLSSMSGDKLNKDSGEPLQRYSYIVRKDTIIELNLEYIMNSNQIGNNPTQFDINRWLQFTNTIANKTNLKSQNRKVRFKPQKNSMPFGYGQRLCIGQNFVLKQVSTMIANLCLNYQFSGVNNNTKFDISFIDGIPKKIHPKVPLCVMSRVSN